MKISTMKFIDIRLVIIQTVKYTNDYSSTPRSTYTVPFRFSDFNHIIHRIRYFPRAFGANRIFPLKEKNPKLSLGSGSVRQNTARLKYNLAPVNGFETTPFISRRRFFGTFFRRTIFCSGLAAYGRRVTSV